MTNERVNHAAKTILTVKEEYKEEYKIVDNFAMEHFNKKYSDQRGNVWYNGYVVINNGNTIRVKYQYGGGDMEMDGHFDVKL